MTSARHPPPARPWLRVLRILIKAGFPVAGVLVLGHACVIAIGGNIRRGEFALGFVLILLSFASKLVPKR